VVEMGAVPREMEEVKFEWRTFTISDAKAMLSSADYDLPTPSI